MFVPRKDRLAIYTHVFREGAIAAKMDCSIPKHNQIATPNIYVIMLMKSLTSRKFAKRTFAWGWAYWTLTEAGIEYLRNYLHLAADVVPNTYQKVETAEETPSFVTSSERPQRGRGNFSGPRRTGDRPPRNFDNEARNFGGQQQRRQ